MKNKRIIYMGTTSFSAHILEELIKEGYDIIALISQPDRAVGRKKEIKYTPTKEVALKYDIKVYGFENINDEFNLIKEMNPDLIITCAYGQKIREEIINYPKYKSINVHASLLPKYRGGAPIHYAIIDGENITGNTIMYMDRELDAGDMLAQSEVEIDIKDTYTSLADKLMYDGAKLLLATLPSLFNNDIIPLKQDESKVVYAPIISREDEFINFDDDVRKVYNKIRGLIDIPGPYALLNNKKIKFFDVSFEVKDSIVNKIKTNNKYFEIGCQNGCILVSQFQLEGKKKVYYHDYRNGNKLEIQDDIFVNEGV